MTQSAHKGQFVGFHDGKMVVINSDRMKLIKRIREERGNVRAFICKVEREQSQVNVPTSRGEQEVLGGIERAKGESK